MKYEIMMGILFDLLSKRSVSAKYLADKYLVSVRSIYRYLSSLELAGIPLYTIRGNGGGFAIVDSYKLSSTFMTRKEFEQVIHALSAITESVPNKDIQSAITKLNALQKHEYSGFDIKSGNLIIDGGPWGDTVGYKTKLIILRKCIEENKKLFIKYHDRNGSVTERTIDPYKIVFKQGIWYTYAYCNLREEFRFFKTGRIESATITDKTFVKKDLSQMELPFDVWYNSIETENVVLKVDKSIVSDIEEWLGIENVNLENGEYIAKAKLPFDNGLISKIMSYGKGIKVLEPKILKNKIIEHAKNIIENY
jgi:predicted DNA-binding transcriptional regulator YafY